MEREYFFSGYCRRQDESRMVCAVTENGMLLEADCDLESCPYHMGCPIAQKIREAVSQ